MQLITAQKVSKILGVSIRTLSRWEKGGFLISHRTIGGHRRYSKSEIENFKKNNMIKNATQRSIISPSPTNVTINLFTTIKRSIVISLLLALLITGTKIVNSKTNFFPKIAHDDQTKILADLSILQDSNIDINVPSTFNDLSTFVDNVNVTGDLSIDGTLTNTSLADGLIQSINGLFSTAEGLDGTLISSNSINFSELLDSMTLDADTSILGAGTADTLTFVSGLITNFAGTLQIAGTTVSSTAAELNYLDGISVTSGGVIYGDGSKLTQDTTKFYWDSTNNRLGVGTSEPSDTFNVEGASLFEGKIKLSDGNTLNIGGISDKAYNALANSGEAPDEAAISSDNDLYIGGDLEVDGTIYGSFAGSIVPSGFTEGSVVFADSSGALAQDNANFFWDDTQDRLGIGTTAPVNKFRISDNYSTDASYTSAYLDYNVSDITAATNYKWFIGNEINADFNNVDSNGFSSVNGEANYIFAQARGTSDLASLRGEDMWVINWQATVDELYGYNIYTENYGTTGDMYGIYNYAINDTDLTNLYGIFNAADSSNYKSSTLATAYGIYTENVNYDSTITTSRAIYSRLYNQNSTALVGTGTLLYLDLANANGTINTLYGIYINDIFEGTQTNAYGIWANEGDWILDEDGGGTAGGNTGGGDLILGEGQDLELYHNGTDSFVVNNTGDLNISTADDIIFDDAQITTTIQLSDVDSTLPNSNTGILDAINDAYNAAVGSSGGLWTRSGTNTYLTNLGDNVGIGVTAPGAKLDFSTVNTDNAKAINLTTSADTSGDDVYGIYNTVSTGTGTLTGVENVYGMYNVVTAQADRDAGWNYIADAYAIYNTLNSTGAFSRSTGVMNLMNLTGSDYSMTYGMVNTSQAGMTLAADGWMSGVYNDLGPNVLIGNGATLLGVENTLDLSGVTGTDAADLYGVRNSLSGASDWGTGSSDVYSFYSQTSTGPLDIAYAFYVGDYSNFSTGGTQYGFYSNFDDTNVTYYPIYEANTYGNNILAANTRIGGTANANNDLSVTGNVDFTGNLGIGMTNPAARIDITAVNTDNAKAINLNVSADTDGDSVYGTYKTINTGVDGILTDNRFAYGGYNAITIDGDTNTSTYTHRSTGYGLYNEIEVVGDYGSGGGVGNKLSVTNPGSSYTEVYGVVNEAQNGTSLTSGAGWMGGVKNDLGPNDLINNDATIVGMENSLDLSGLGAGNYGELMGVFNTLWGADYQGSGSSSIYGFFHRAITGPNDVGYGFYVNDTFNTSSGGTQYGFYSEFDDTNVTYYPIYEANTYGNNILAANTRIGSTANANNDLSVTGNADVTGNLGIGVTNPGYSLDTYHATNDILAEFESGDSLAGIQITDTSDTMYMLTQNNRMSMGANNSLHANNLNIDSSGNVGIGVTAPTDTMHVNGQAFATGGVHIGVDQDNNLFDDASNGSGTSTMYIGNASINVTASDARLKENISDSEINALDIIDQLKVVDFDWIDNEEWAVRGRWSGMIAQEVYEVLPQVVNKPVNPHSTWAIEYHHLVPYLVKGIQEQQIEIDTQGDVVDQVSDGLQTTDYGIKDLQINAENMEQRIEELENQISNLKQQVELQNVSDIQSVENEELAFASQDINVNSILTTDLTVLGKAILADTTVTGIMNIGTIQINPLDNSIDAIGPLKIQPLGLGKVEFLGGLVEIDTEGRLSAVEVTANKYKVAGASAGNGILSSNEVEVFIETNQIVKDSMVFITLTSAARYPLNAPKNRYVLDENDNSIVKGFWVEIYEAETSDVEFSWWIVDKNKEEEGEGIELPSSI